MTSIASQIIGGLQVLHCNGVLHHNIKPSNILIFTNKTGDKVYKLGGFGAFGCNNYSNSTLLVKPIESLKESKFIDKSDVWQLRILFF